MRMILHSLCLPTLFIASSAISGVAAAVSKIPLDLLSVTFGGDETNGCGSPGPSSLSTGSMILLTGDDDYTCGDDTLWTRFVKSDGTAMDLHEEEAGYFTRYDEEDAWYERSSPQIVRANEITGMVASVAAQNAYRDDDIEFKVAVRTISPGSKKYKHYEQDEMKQPIDIAMLNDGNVAMIHEGSLNVGRYELKDNGKLTLLEEIKLDGMKKPKNMIYDAVADALYVAGNVSGGNRGIAKVDASNYKLVWLTSVNAKVGTPVLHLRRKNLKSMASEVLMLSRSFYARVAASDGSEIFVKKADDGEYMPWLPKGVTPRAVYDPTRDVIYTTGDTRLREHNVKTGAVLGEEEFYFDPPKSWNVKIKDSNPATELSDYPPYCGDTTYPNHPDVPKGKFENVDEDSGCERTSKTCRNASCEDWDICCMKDDCCILDSYFFENWRRVPTGLPDGVDSQAVHVTSDGKIHVVLVFSGYVDDEDDYYQTSLATFKYTGENNGDDVDDDDNSDSGSVKCTDQTNQSKSKCRQMVTSTGCYWSKSKGCIEATKCSRIKKNEKACLGATEYDCAYFMRKENKFVCNDNTIEKACDVAQDKTACQYNGCSWRNGDCSGDDGRNVPKETKFVEIRSEKADHMRFYVDEGEYEKVVASSYGKNEKHCNNGSWNLVSVDGGFQIRGTGKFDGKPSEKCITVTEDWWCFKGTPSEGKLTVGEGKPCMDGDKTQIFTYNKNGHSELSPLSHPDLCIKLDNSDDASCVWGSALILATCSTTSRRQQWNIEGRTCEGGCYETAWNKCD